MKKFVKNGMIGAGIVAALGVILMIAGTILGGTLSSLIEEVSSHTYIADAIDWYERHSYRPTEHIIEEECLLAETWPALTTEYYDEGYPMVYDTYMGGQILGLWDASDVNSIDLEFASGNLEIIPMSESNQIVLEALSPCEITEASLNGGFLEIDVESGSDPQMYLLIPENMILGDVKLSADIGYVNCISLCADNLEVDMDAGSFYAESLQINEELKMDMDAGELWVNEATCSLLNISNDTGNVSFTGHVEGDVYLDTDAGAIDVYLNSSTRDYNYNLNCDLGTIYLNGSEISGWGNNYSIDNGAQYQLQAQCDIGSISIYLE